MFALAARRLESVGSLGVRDPLYAPDPAARPRRCAFYLEPLGVRCLFTTGETSAIQFKSGLPPGLHRDPLGAFRLMHSIDVPVAYEVEHYPTGSGRVLLGPTSRQRVAQACLQVPDAVDGPRLRAWGERALREAGVLPSAPPARVAEALAEHLRRNFRYTLAPELRQGVEPLEDFLFRRRAGHCELFASAHAMVLRTLGIPARLVTGFRGGEPSRWSDGITVRQCDAHAWVEVLTDAGWLPFDPTPAEPPRPGVGQILGLARDVLDWLELRWFAQVIAFDAYDQRNALRLLREYLAALTAGTGAAAQLPVPDAWILLVGALLLALLAAAARAMLARLRAGAGLLRWARHRVRSTPGERSIRRLLDALARRGCVRRPGETPREVVARAGLPPELRDRLDAWIDAYYGDRFGGRPFTAGEQERLLRLIAELARTRSSNGYPGVVSRRAGQLAPEETEAEA